MSSLNQLFSGKIFQINNPGATTINKEIPTITNVISVVVLAIWQECALVNHEDINI
jgi:hypothetical protein